jgi:hypothetical protein
MAKISEIQAETGILEGTASLITASDFTPSGGTNNGVSADGGLDYLKFNTVSVPSGTTKILFFVKKKVANATNSTFQVGYLGNDSQYNVGFQTITAEGLHSIEVTTLPTAGNNLWVLDGANLLYDRIEFHNDSATVSGSDIIIQSGSILTKNTGTAKFKNTGLAIPTASTITFLPTFTPTYIGTVTATSTKGTFAASGSNLVLTLTSGIAADESFDIAFSLSAFIKKSTTFTFDVTSVTGFTESNLTNDTTSATFTPTADISVTEMSKDGMGFWVKITNIGTDVIESGQVISVKANGSGVPSGSNLTASTAKGVFSGTDWINGVSLTLSSDFEVGQEFMITFTFASAVSTSYTAAVSATWISTVTDSVSSNNSISVVYSPSALVAPPAPILSTVLAVYSGDSQNGTATEAGTILMLLNGNVVSQTTTSGTNNAWSIVCANVGSYTFKLTTANGTSVASSAVAVVARASGNTSNNSSSGSSNDLAGITNKTTTTSTNKTSTSKIFSTTNILIFVGLIIIAFSIWWLITDRDDDR